MKALSQSEYGELRKLYESVYAPKVETIFEDFTDEDFDLTDEEIEEQVEDIFLECIEEGYEIDEIERAICEAVDAELEVLNEVTSPAKVAVARMKNKAAAAGGEGSGDAGAKARAKLNVSKQKVSGSSEKKASTLSKVKGAVKKVAKAAQGGVGLASRAVGTAQRAASAVKDAAKKGYERGRQGAGGSSSSSSSASTSSSSSSSASTPSSSSSSSSGGSSDAPKKRKDGLLKRAIKKVVRGVSKGVSAAAGAVKAGADSVTDRARKEELEATGLFSDSEIEAIMEAEMSEGYKEIDAKKHGRMYDRYKKLRSAAIKDAQDSGEASGTNRMKMGKMSAVIDKSSENLRKKQTKDQLTGRG